MHYPAERKGFSGCSEVKYSAMVQHKLIKNRLSDKANDNNEVLGKGYELYFGNQAVTLQRHERIPTNPKHRHDEEQAYRKKHIDTWKK